MGCSALYVRSLVQFLSTNNLYSSAAHALKVCMPETKRENVRSYTTSYWSNCNTWKTFSTSSANVINLSFWRLRINKEQAIEKMMISPFSVYFLAMNCPAHWKRVVKTCTAVGYSHLRGSLFQHRHLFIIVRISPFLCETSMSLFVLSLEERLAKRDS